MSRFNSLGDFYHRQEVNNRGIAEYIAAEPIVQDVHRTIRKYRIPLDGLVLALIFGAISDKPARDIGIILVAHGIFHKVETILSKNLAAEQQNHAEEVAKKPSTDDLIRASVYFG